MPAARAQVVSSGYRDAQSSLPATAQPIEESSNGYLQRFLFIAWLIVMAISIEAYRHSGMAAAETFTGDIQALSWRAQFNLDFLAHLTLFGVWVAWRHRFEPAGLALGLACVLGGGAFSLANLLCASITAKGMSTPCSWGRNATKPRHYPRIKKPLFQ